MPAGVSAYVPLANVTLSSSAASVTFSSISQVYRDLVLVVRATGTGNDRIRMKVNGDNTGANYQMVFMEGDGSNAYSFTSSGEFYGDGLANPMTSTLAELAHISIMDYSATDKHKSVLWRTNSPSVVVSAMAGRWASTSAITSLVFYNTGSFAAGSTFALYGVSA